MPATAALRAGHTVTGFVEETILGQYENKVNCDHSWVLWKLTLDFT